MAQVKYPYLDLTVLKELRPHIIAPNAAVLFDPEIKNIFWTNGEGAGIIGVPTVREALEEGHVLNPAMRRQIVSAVEQLDDEDDVGAVIRVRRGFKTQLVGFSVKPMKLPDGDKAILLITESLHGRGHSLEDMAQAAVDCLDGYSHASAIVDDGGAVVATSGHFAKLEVEQSELEALVKEVSTESDRLVKRPIATKSGTLPAGIARLSDAPASHILIIADASEQLAPDTQGANDGPIAEQSNTHLANGATAENATETDTENEDTAPRVGAFSNRRSPSSTNSLGRWYYKPQPEEGADQSEGNTEVAADNDGAASDHENQSNTSQNDPTPSALAGSGLIQETQHSTPDAEDGVHPDSPELAPTSKSTISSSSDETDEQNRSSREEENTRFAAQAKPVRFVWEMDTENRFRSVSEEFGNAVGKDSADVVGKTWQQVAAQHNLENGEEINALLEKGDTWSGKTVLWPVDGTDLRVPIDFAGLPSYGRNHGFEGFNGFGIVRTADAVVHHGEEQTNISAVSSADTADDSPTPSETSKATAKEKDDRKSDRALSSDERETFEEIGEKLSDTPLTGKAKTDTTQSKSASSSVREIVPSAFARKPKKDIDSSRDAAADASDARKDESNVDTSILSRLPIPVLVYRDTELLFANQEFFSVTGHNDLTSLADAGGIESLFGAQNNDDSTARVFHADGRELDYSANLQSVPWDSDRAMLLTLRKRFDGENNNEPEEPSGSIGHNSAPDSTANDGSPVSRLSAAPSGGETHRLADNAHNRIGDEQHQAFGGLEAEDLRSILDTATDGVVILSDEGVIRALNRSAEALFDVDPQEVIDHSFTKILAPESHRLAMDYLSGISGPGISSLMNDGREVFGKTAKGGLIPLFMTIGKLEKTDACCAVVRDITEWKKAEEELVTAKSIAESASAQKTEFLAKISHEIRTPLNAIIGFSDLMIEERFGKIDNDRYRGYLRDIHRSGNHVLELINDLLDISKIEAGKMELEFDACDLNTTISETVALTQPEANKERIIIRTSLSAVVPKVVADPRSLRQIILNLVSNSIKYTKPGGQVIVSTVYEENGEVVLRIRDTGIGMSELELARAMKPFQQINAESDTQGTGLGLPLTKAMVEANRARFEIESEPEEGTLVEIYFPTQRVLADR